LNSFNAFFELIPQTETDFKEASTAILSPSRAFGLNEALIKILSSWHSLSSWRRMADLDLIMPDKYSELASMLAFKNFSNSSQEIMMQLEQDLLMKSGRII